MSDTEDKVEGIPAAVPAAAAVLCHTPEECAAMYAAIPAEVKAPALALLSETLLPVADDIRLTYEQHPEDWWKKSRLVGMALRNLLRSRNFGEEYFNVHNLDDIYTLLIEEALKLR